MSKGWSIALFCTVFFLLFMLFQLDSETRRRNRSLQNRLQELDLKIATYIRGAEAHDPTEKLAQMQFSQQSLVEDFKKERKTSIELLELLITNDEKFEREIKQMQEDIKQLKQQTAL